MATGRRHDQDGQLGSRLRADARARSFQFITTEIVFSLLLWLFTMAGTALFGFRGVSIAYAATYTLYLLTVYILVMGVGRRPVRMSIVA